MTGVKEDSGESCTTNELDKSGEVYTVHKIRSTKEMDNLGEGDAIEEALKKKKDDRYEEEKELAYKAVPKRKKWLTWWKKQLKGASDPNSEVHPDHKKAPGQSQPRLQTKQAASQRKHVLRDMTG